MSLMEVQEVVALIESQRAWLDVPGSTPGDDGDRGRAIESSLRYLVSPEAEQSLLADPYWPKWDSPWWHVTLLREMGRGDRIPKMVSELMARRIRIHYLSVFPLLPSELASATDPYREICCHCAWGNILQALAPGDSGDLSDAMPAVKGWFPRYRMRDGGLSCDNEAYLRPGSESSMVGTIAGLEAVLSGKAGPWAAADLRFLEEGAGFLIARELRWGSHAEEREDEADWLNPCFPRYYFYDVLRGMTYLTRWSETFGSAIPAKAILPVLRSLIEKNPAGEVRVARKAIEGVSTLRQSHGEWIRRQPAGTFELLDQVSRVGEVSPFLSGEWRETLLRLRRIHERGHLH